MTLREYLMSNFIFIFFAILSLHKAIDEKENISNDLIRRSKLQKKVQKGSKTHLTLTPKRSAIGHLPFLPLWGN
jgi:hypothetical protein